MTETTGLRQMLLSDVDVQAISLVKEGANGQRIILRKSEAAGDELTAASRIVKEAGDDWSVFYIVVAEPGRAEQPGVGDGAGEPIVDVWADEKEIEKAAHRFMHNGALVNRMHEDLAPYGKLVENCVAPADIDLGNGEVIKKGSWFVGIEPTSEGRELINKGEFTGVSIQGSGIRTPSDGGGEFAVKPRVAKGTDVWLTDYDRELIGDMMIVEVQKAGSSAALPDLDWSAADNWIDRLPAAMGAAFKRSWIYRAAKHLTYEVYGGNRGRAFAVAIEAARKGCKTGDLNWPGAQSVNAGSRAEMCAAVALWEQMKATNAAQKLTKAAEAAIANLDDPDGAAQDERTTLEKLAQFVGLTTRTFTIDQRYQLAKAGQAIPVRDSTGKLVDGRHPIENEGDLRAAIAAYTRSPDDDEVKRHIAKLAKHLGKTDLLPPSLEGVAKEAGTVEPVSDTTDTGTEKTVEQRVGDLEGLVGGLKEAIDGIPGQIAKAIKGDDGGNGSGDGSGNGNGNGGSGDGAAAAEASNAELKKELEEAREDIKKLAAGESVQTGDEFTQAEKDQIAKAAEGGDGWEGLMF